MIAATASLEAILMSRSFTLKLYGPGTDEYLILGASDHFADR